MKQKAIDETSTLKNVNQGRCSETKNDLCIMKRCRLRSGYVVIVVLFGYVPFFFGMILNQNNYYETIKTIDEHQQLHKKKVTHEIKSYSHPVLQLKPENFRRIDSDFRHYELPYIKYQFQCKNTNNSSKEIPEDILCMKRPRFMYNYKNPCWKENGKKIRCLPYFNIFGVCKSGTTDLFRRMFNGQYTEGDVETLNDFINKFDVIPKRLKYNIQKDRFYSDFVTGHADPMDIWYPYDSRKIPQNNPSMMEPVYITPHLIRHVNPNIKLILLLRNPVDRVYSHYLHKMRGRGELPSPMEFHYDTHRSMSLFYKCTRNRGLRPCLYDQELYNISKVPLSSGLYDVFLKDWMNVFRKDQILVLRTEDYKNDINGTLDKVFQFLELEKVNKDVMGRMYKQKRLFTTEDKKPMLNETRDVLRTFYQQSQSNLNNIIQV